MSSEVGILVYIFLMSNEQSFVFISILAFIRYLVGLYEFWKLNMCDNVSVLFSIMFMCFPILYPGLCFQLTIGRMGLSCLCNFIVPYYDIHLLFCCICLNYYLCFVVFTSNVMW
jgi:hypothetical protein